MEIYCAVTSPKFTNDEELIRYIDPDERQGSRHAASSAFLLNEIDQASNNAHLSVNSRELETVAEIASYYRKILQGDEGEVAFCLHRVYRYVENGKKAGAALRTNTDRAWCFDESDSETPAFKHRPITRSRSDSRPSSPSHCGVEFIRTLTETQQRAFARRMAQKPRFQVLEQT
jgi:hypothetical protein